MGKINKNNPYRNKWMLDAEKWIFNNINGINEVVDRSLCPRCGLKMSVENKSLVENLTICDCCHKDEISRSQMGLDTVRLPNWYITTNKKLGYLKNCRMRIIC